MNRLFVKRNITSVAIIIFVMLFMFIQYLEPIFLYEKSGALRQFGLGSKKKTILPIWLFALILAILSYLFVLYYITYPKYQF